MRIIHAKSIPAKYSTDVKNLLRLCDQEFVPPLSSRDGTSQTDFQTKQQAPCEPVTYYRSICGQENFLVIDKNQVIGIMSYVCDYVSEVTVHNTPNIYISTLIVHPDHRRLGLANKLYAKMLKKHGNRYIFTRTWSTNGGHIRILSSLKFYEVLRIENDRGPEIDTVYFRREPEQLRFFTLIRQYRLQSNLIFFGALSALTILSVILWMTTDSEVMQKLYLAFATSFLASALCLFSDIIIKYKESKNDEYINRLKSFGIANLQFHKDQLLEQLLPGCREEIWISGYRLIMTGKKQFLESMRLAAAHSKHLKIRLMAVPPWSDAFKFVYGSDDVTRNYYTVFKALASFAEQYGTDVEIRFTQTPIFNDTYKVDDRFVTGPYLHCADKMGAKITAKDFFSFDIDDPKKELYDIMYQDYVAVWSKCGHRLNLMAFYKKAKTTNENSFFENDSLQNYLLELNEKALP